MLTFRVGLPNTCRYLDERTKRPAILLSIQLCQCCQRARSVVERQFCDINPRRIGVFDGVAAAGTPVSNEKLGAQDVASSQLWSRGQNLGSEQPNYIDKSKERHHGVAIRTPKPLRCPELSCCLDSELHTKLQVHTCTMKTTLEYALVKAD